MELENMFSGLGDFIMQKPEQFSIMADMVGSRLAPNNAFAGVGGMMGKSSLANKALADEKKEKQDFRTMLADLMSGKVPMTPAGTPGVTSATIKPNKEGGSNELNFSVTEPTDEGKQKQLAGQTLSMGDLMSSPFYLP